MTQTPVFTTLKTVLADSYALYLKTQNYHWNVEGPQFKTLHLLFEEQYTNLAMAVDTVAELIRGLNEKVPGTFTAFAKLTSIQAGNENTTATEMVQELAADQSLIQKSLEIALTAAQNAKDEVVANFIIERLTAHRKAAWMLNSSV